MKILPSLLSAAVTIGLVITLNTKLVLPAPLGKLLSPQHGVWQNAESDQPNFSADLKFPQLKGKVNVYLDERLVPHVFAEQDNDAYFVQGYLHARFRLWQMELQTHFAAGRLCEIVGDKALKLDREKRRMGMVYAAENALKAMEKDPVSKGHFDNYTAGVNAYINSLTASSLPLEYKLMGYQPEPWKNLKTALMLKEMSNTLAGYDEDLEMTNAKSLFTPDELKLLYPETNASLEPIVPKGTAFDKPGIVPIKPVTADSLYFNTKDSLKLAAIHKPDPDNGSNNWAVSGKKTKAGAPILCNDPHLELSLPSIWYEMQISTPNTNTYGVSLPGSPYIIIGYNDSLAWGVTNAQRDVKDYYEIKFRDDSKKEYWFDSSWKQSELKIEEIKIKDQPSYYDTVAYTVFGPVMYDKSFNQAGSKGRNLAVRWVAHDQGNEGFTFYKLDNAKSYEDYLEAIKPYNCPGQNFLVATKSNHIAIWQQAKFPARWQGQGLYVMPGQDSSYMWQGFIPQAENPHSVDPDRGFCTSANQRPVDSTYPYFIPGYYITERGIAITDKLTAMDQITTDDMMKLQNDYYNVFASKFLPFMMKYIRENDLDAPGKKFLSTLSHWNYENGPDAVAPTVFSLLKDSLKAAVWEDEINRTSPAAPMPGSLTLLEALVKDSTFKFIDNIRTPQKESLFDIMTLAFKNATSTLKHLEQVDSISWFKYKDPTIYHLTRQSLMPFARKSLHVGGGGDIINATTHSHGPSWRMIVNLTPQTEAYAVYPGGQNGNPGSKYYDSFVDTWAAGKYFSLWMMTKEEARSSKVKWVMKFDKS